MKREYFYKKDGKVLPYHYCTECDKKFTDEEFEQGLVIKVGLSASPVKLCKSPCFNIKFPKVIKKQPEWSLDHEPKPKHGRPRRYEKVR